MTLEPICLMELWEKEWLILLTNKSGNYIGDRLQAVSGL
jgi:hypothetical protein